MPLHLRISNSSRFILLALFGAGIGLRMLILANQQFDGLYGQDAYAYYDFADELRFAAGTGSAPPAFFWPLGYPAVLAGAFALFGTTPEIGQAVNIVLAALVPLLVYGIARQMNFGQSAAFAAALIVVCCGQVLQSSVVMMADIPALFWATLSACTLLAYRQHRHLHWLIIAAAALALACISRWLYLILFIPFGALYLLMRGSVRHAVMAGLCASLVFLPQFAYSLHSPFPVFNHAWVQGWSPSNAFQREFVNVDGAFTYQQPNAIFYGQPFNDPRYLAPILTPMLVMGLWALRKRGQLLTLLGGWALLPYIFLTGIPYQNIRFPLIVVPATALLCGAGIAYTVKRMPRSFRPLVLGGFVGLSAAWMLGAGTALTRDFIGWQAQDRAVAEWTAGQLPDGVTIYTFDITLTLRHRTSFRVVDLYYETPETLRAKWEYGREDYLLLNLWQLQSQFQGREPYIAAYWLQTYRGLDRLGQYGNYSLFRVRGL